MKVLLYSGLRYNTFTKRMCIRIVFMEYVLYALKQSVGLNPNLGGVHKIYTFILGDVRSHYPTGKRGIS